MNLNKTLLTNRIFKSYSRNIFFKSLSELEHP